jgi:hypothetical protein
MSSETLIRPTPESLTSRLTTAIRSGEPIDWGQNQSFEALAAITRPLEHFALTPYGELDQSLCRVTNQAWDKFHEELGNSTRKTGLSYLAGYYGQLSALEKRFELNYQKSKLEQPPESRPPSPLFRLVVRNQLAILDSHIDEAVSNFISPRQTPVKAAEVATTAEEINLGGEAVWDPGQRLRSSDMLPPQDEDTARTFFTQEAYQRLRKELTGPDRVNGLNCLATYYRRLLQLHHKAEADYSKTNYLPNIFKVDSPPLLRLVLRSQIALLDTLVDDIFHRLNPPKRQSIERIIEKVKSL